MAIVQENKLVMEKSKKIAILFLDEIHHVYHFISVAAELAKTNQVHILTHTGDQTFLEDTLKLIGPNNVVVEKLPTATFRAITDKLKGRKLPRKGFWLKKNKTYILNNFDAIIFTDYFHKYLLNARGENKNPKFIKFPHGVAGRAYGYNKDLLDFDLHVLFGQYYYDQLRVKNLLSKENVVVGYPKLDVLKNVKTDSIFKDNKPTVLYNPHFSPPFSSWHFCGKEILEFFLLNKDYNLIFAPHINLFNKVGGDDMHSVAEKYFNAKNIHIDLGSENSVNMTYLNSADIYLGDVSSQSFEFMINPRPCIFLNPGEIDYKNDLDYRFWRCGEVLNSVKNLKTALDSAPEKFKDTYKTIQEKVTQENFYFEEGSTASERAAKEIIQFLDSDKQL